MGDRSCAWTDGRQKLCMGHHPFRGTVATGMPEEFVFKRMSFRICDEEPKSKCDKIKNRQMGLLHSEKNY